MVKNNALTYILHLGTLILPLVSSNINAQWDPFNTNETLENTAKETVDPLSQSCEKWNGYESPKEIALSVAIDRALCKNPATRTAWANARQQSAALGMAESAWLPQVTGTAGRNQLTGSHSNSIGQLIKNTQQTTNAVLNLSWILYDFGLRQNKITSANRSLEAAALTANTVSQQTTRDVTRNYYSVIAADESLKAAHITEQNYSHSLEIAKARFASGVAPLSDVMQTETAYNQATLLRLQAENTTKTARGNFSISIGINANQSLNPIASPIPSDIPLLSSNITELMNEAIQQRPDLAAANAQRDAAQADIGVAKATGMPTISITMQKNYLDYSNPSSQLDYQSIGVTANWPLFTGFNNNYAIRQAQSVLEAKEANIEQIHLNITGDVWSNYNTLLSANEQLKVTANLVKNANTNEEIALGRYKSGIGTIIDIINAQNVAANARQQRVNAEFTWQVTRIQLALALGRLSGLQPLDGLNHIP